MCVFLNAGRVFQKACVAPPARRRVLLLQLRSRCALFVASSRANREARPAAGARECLGRARSAARVVLHLHRALERCRKLGRPGRVGGMDQVTDDVVHAQLHAIGSAGDREMYADASFQIAHVQSKQDTMSY